MGVILLPWVGVASCLREPWTSIGLGIRLSDVHRDQSVHGSFSGLDDSQARHPSGATRAHAAAPIQPLPKARTAGSSARAPWPSFRARPRVRGRRRPRRVGQPRGFASSAPGGHPTDHLVYTVSGAPFCFTWTARSLAGCVVLAFRDTVCTSSGDS